MIRLNMCGPASAGRNSGLKVSDGSNRTVKELTFALKRAALGSQGAGQGSRTCAG